MTPRVPSQRVSPRARTFWTVRALALWLVVLAGLGAAAGAHPASWLLALLAGVAVVAAVHVVVMPRWRFRVHRWELTDTAVHTQTGWLSQERRVAPVARVQTVDTERGPLAALFGLADLTVTTASAAGPLHIPGLDREVAARLAREITLRAERAGGDGT